MNDATLTLFREALAVPSTRALLITLNDDGSLAHQPVRYGQSVVDIHNDLRDHLTASPRSTDWLQGLHAFLGQWLQARSDAAKFGGLVVQVDDDSSMGVRYVQG